MINSEYSTGDCKSPKISIGAITRHPELVKFVSDHFKTKNMCKHTVKELSFIIRCVPDRYKTQ